MPCRYCHGEHADNDCPKIRRVKPGEARGSHETTHMRMNSWHCATCNRRNAPERQSCDICGARRNVKVHSASRVHSGGQLAPRGRKRR